MNSELRSTAAIAKLEHNLQKAESIVANLKKRIRDHEIRRTSLLARLEDSKASKVEIAKRCLLLENNFTLPMDLEIKQAFHDRVLGKYLDSIRDFRLDTEDFESEPGQEIEWLASSENDIITMNSDLEKYSATMGEIRATMKTLRQQFPP